MARGAVVVIVSDGWEVGDPALVGRSMERLSRLAHSHADTIVTPMNDSFVDLDLIAKVDPETLKVVRPSLYAEMVWEQRKQRALRDRGSIDWVVMRNRLAAIEARNKRAVGQVLEQLARRQLGDGALARRERPRGGQSP